jgi:hypothetical protein
MNLIFSSSTGSKKQRASVEVESNPETPQPECSFTVSSPTKTSSPAAVCGPPESLGGSSSFGPSLGGLREEEYHATRTDYQYKVTKKQPQYSSSITSHPSQHSVMAIPGHQPYGEPVPLGQIQVGDQGGVDPYHPCQVLSHPNIAPPYMQPVQSLPSQPMQPSMSNISQPCVAPNSCSFQSPIAPPSRDEFNNHRLNMLESSFLQSQRTSLLESKLSSRCNFDLALPSLEDYHRLPMEPVRAELPFRPSVKGQGFGDKAGEGEEVCYCGLVPVTHEVKAPGSDFGRKFLSCIQKEVNQCSFFKWIKKETKKVDIISLCILLTKFNNSQPEVVDIHCNCGKVSAVRTVVKNGSNFGRMYYCCAMVERCSFFWFVDPDLHYKDRQKCSSS